MPCFGMKDEQTCDYQYFGLDQDMNQIKINGMLYKLKEGEHKRN